MRAVVVTGCSTGIGHASARALIARGTRVFGSVRRAEDGAALAAELGDTFSPLVFDVTDQQAIAIAAAKVRSDLGGQRLFGLVNNAGIAVAGPLLHLPMTEFRQQLEVNVTGQLMVTQAFAPLLGADPMLAGAPGRIVMVSSVSGVHGAPFVGAYAASKFALEGLSESLRRELMIYGIDVVVVGPGAVRTPIWDKADKVDTSPYDTTDYATALQAVKTYMLDIGRTGVPAESVGALIADILFARSPRVRYAIAPSRIEAVAMRLLPKRWLDRVIAWRLGLIRRP